MIFEEILNEKSESTRQVNSEKNFKKKNIEINPIVGKYYEAPEHHRDNEYIHSGYRINFNSSWEILKSLFVLHNEFVNVWSHIIGALVVIILIVYTSFYIQSHKSEIMNNFNTINYMKNYMDSEYFQNITQDIKNNYKEGKEFVNKYAGKLKNSTSDYMHSLDEKFVEFRDYFNDISCPECLQKLMTQLSHIRDQFQNNLNEMKTKIKILYEAKMPNMNMSDYYKGYNFTKIYEEFNEKLISLKNEIMEKLDSKEMEWIIDNIYSQADHDNNNLINRENELYFNNNNYYDNHSKLHKWPLFIFLMSAILCLSFSATFHLCFIHSQNVSEILGKLDYAGISLLIMGSCYPPYYYLFYYSTCKF